jgi:hypothetical protein
MSETQKREGTVAFFNFERGIGFIQSRSEADPTKFEKFFFHVARLASCESDLKDIRIGYYARFYPSTAPPKKPGDAPYAMDVELYLAAPQTVAGLDTLAGVDALADEKSEVAR